MKFKIRAGFILTRIDQVQLDDDKFVEQATNGYPGQTIDLTAEQAIEHLHMLEPADKEAAKFVESRTLTAPPEQLGAGGVGLDIAAAISAGVKAGVEAGLAAALAAQAAVQAPAQDVPQTSGGGKGGGPAPSADSKPAA